MAITPKSYWNKTILRMRSLEAPSSFYNSRTEDYINRSTSLAETQKAVEAHGCKPWVANLSMVPSILDIATNSKCYLSYC